MIVDIDGTKFEYSYFELQCEYERFCAMTDEEFMTELPVALHLAVAICYFKEINVRDCCSDKGVIHELAHLLHFKDKELKEGTSGYNIRGARSLFEKWLKLV